jgi:hypothetical protein
MWDMNGLDEITVVSPFQQNPVNEASTAVFSDTPAVNEFSYDQIDFNSYADNYWTQVSVTPLGSSVVTVTQAGATTPYRTYSINTLNSSTGQATDFANYLASLYSTPQFRIASISCLSTDSLNVQIDKLGTQTPVSYPGMRVTVKFRGTTYSAIIEGVTISATPESSRYTFTLSAAEQNNYLILDSTVYGRLDYNKLGY